MRTNLTLLASAFVAITELPARAGNKTVCVQVMVRGPEAEKPKPPSLPPPPRLAAPGEPKPIEELETPSPPPPRPKPPADPNVPIGQEPVTYLKRLIEYFVTHERGFVAVQSGCQERIDVELYPLQQGWTIFARYSGSGREERVDYLLSDELSQFAERVVTALLYERPISTTILRDTVLRADSKKSAQRIKGSNHFLLGLGTPIRISVNGLPTATEGTNGAAPDSLRYFFPIEMQLGYRGKFESWGLETLFGLVIGTDKTGLKYNDQGGHVDYGGNVNFKLHFLRYSNPRGLTSWFYGAGGSFELLWFYQINSLADRGSKGDRSTVVTGGFNIDVVGGIEFMRASKVQFFLEAALLVPVYMVENSDGPSNIKVYFPGLALTMGMMF